MKSNKEITYLSIIFLLVLTIFIILRLEIQSNQHSLISDIQEPSELIESNSTNLNPPYPQFIATLIQDPTTGAVFSFQYDSETDYAVSSLDKIKGNSGVGPVFYNPHGMIIDTCEDDPPPSTSICSIYSKSSRILIWHTNSPTPY